MTERKILKVGIVVKPGDDEALRTAGELAEWLEARAIELVGEPYCPAEAIQENADAASASLCATADLIVVLGGDGTMISTARLIGDADVLVLGINYGSLGYLTDFRIEEMYSALEAIFEGRYEIDRRVMISANTWRDDAMLAKAAC